MSLQPSRHIIDVMRRQSGSEFLTMKNNLNVSETGLNHHPINAIFYVNLLRHAAGKVVLGLTLREEFRDSGGPSCGSLGLIVEYAVKTASQRLMEHCFLVEYEVSFISATSGREFVVNAEIDYSHKPNALFYCKICEGKSLSDQIIAVSHGVLLGRDAASPDSN